MKRLLLLFCLIFALPAKAATFVITEAGGHKIIKIDGQIVEHDYDKFIYYVVMYPEIKAVQLNSNGGLVFEGLEIGSKINERGMNTLIGENEKCVSICAVMFLSGKNKFLYKSSALGVHTVKNTITNQRDDKTNNMISWYFGHLGFSLGLVEKWVFTEPESMTFLTYKDSVELNLGVTTIDGQN